MTLKERLEVAQVGAQILALVAIPVLVAYFGWKIQEEQRQKEVGRDFVQIAISVLAAPENDHPGSIELKAWAGRLLSSVSPIPFRDDEFQALLVSENAKALRTALSCTTPHVQQPKWAAEDLKGSDSLEVKVRALLAERRQRIGYERELLAANEACR